MTRAHKYQNILLVISVSDNIHSVLPGLEAFYRLHFPNILYCVQNKVDDDFIDKWKISVLWLPEDVSAIPCLLAAGKMQFGVRGLLHISANMLLNAGTERMLTRVDSLVWMPGEFDAYEQSTQLLCYRKAIACRHRNRDVLTKALGLINFTPSLTEPHREAEGQVEGVRLEDRTGSESGDEERCGVDLRHDAVRSRQADRSPLTAA